MLRKHLIIVISLISSSLWCIDACSTLAKMPSDMHFENTNSCQNKHSLADIKSLLNQYTDTLSPDLLKASETALTCANKINDVCNNYLTIIDYSLPSNQKRLWVFSLNDKKLLYHTYVSHGLKSGIRDPYYFTNALNSKASSIGLFATEESYYGRDGLSLKLKGLEKSFNDNAMRRSLVMHSAWYAEEDFIKKYGRAGRSWGCPAIPLNLCKPIVG